MKRLPRWLLMVLLSASAVPAQGADSFEGSCEFSGTVYFGRPAQVFLAANAFALGGSGTCTGFLNGVAIESRPAAIEAFGGGVSSCFAHVLSGGGTLVLGGDQNGSVEFAFEMLGPGLAHGADENDGRVIFQFAPRLSPEVTAACLGHGNWKMGVDVKLQMLSPVEG